MSESPMPDLRGVSPFDVDPCDSPADQLDSAWAAAAATAPAELRDWYRDTVQSLDLPDAPGADVITNVELILIRATATVRFDGELDLQDADVQAVLSQLYSANLIGCGSDLDLPTEWMALMRADCGSGTQRACHTWYTEHHRHCPDHLRLHGEP